MIRKFPRPEVVNLQVLSNRFCSHSAEGRDGRVFTCFSIETMRTPRVLESTEHMTV